MTGHSKKALFIRGQKYKFSNEKGRKGKIYFSKQKQLKTEHVRARAGLPEESQDRQI